jgi:hypothetical protein
MHQVKGKSIKYDAFTLMAVLQMEWQDMPNRVLRAEMAKRGLSYFDLVVRLHRIGVIENERSLRNKVARGTFSAMFLLQCMVAMDAMVMDLNAYELPPLEPRKMPRSGGS